MLGQKRRGTPPEQAKKDGMRTVEQKRRAWRPFGEALKENKKNLQF